VTCRACQQPNPDDAAFCGSCGAPLQKACPSCGRDNPPGQAFCNGCGQRLGPSPVERSTERAPRDYTPRHLAEKILRSRSALEGERKLVTVLFADVKGSLELAGKLDPEEWHRILDRFFQILTDGVHRFEGTVNQYTGDGIMALFGAPIAHEDHAQRACYAALQLRDALGAYANEVRLSHGLDFAVRIGIHTGEVVVGKIGDDLRMDYTAQGATVGLAQRLEQMAAAQSICLSDATAGLVSGYVELRELGPATAKGLTGPIHVFELVGSGKVRTRLDVARSRGLTRFVGRDADLHTLEAALEQASAGDGQVVGVVAEAGVGKSRLCLEFVELCRARGISVNEGHCPAHGKTVSYLPLLELLRGIFGIGERDGDFEARGKIEGELLTLDASFEPLLPLVFDFLGVRDPQRPLPQLPPNARQQQLVTFVRQLVKALSSREPRVLLIDDAHWIDAGSDAFLAQLVEAVPGTRTLVVVNFRPEYHAAWMARASYRQLPLPPLGPEATEELLADLVGRDASLVVLAERIHERTRGTPFFVEEVVISLVESGRLAGSRGAYRLVAPLEAIEIPSTVQAVLAARIDRLPEREKRLLQIASVIGRQVPANVLERVAELPETERSAALATLVQAEFLFEKALYPEAEYAFKHPLTHEVAYRSQLAERRAWTHAAVASAVEEVDAERLDEQAALLAYHRERAGELLLAARWNNRAARHRVTNDQLGAIEHWRTARSILAKAGESDEQLELEACRGLLGYAAWYGAAEDEIAACFARGRALAEGTGDQRSLCHLHLHYAIWHGMVRSDSATCAQHAQLAAELAERVGDKGAALAAASGLALVRYLEGRVSDAISLGRRSLPREPDDPMLGSEYWSVPPVLWLQALTHHLEGWAGRPRKSLADLEGLIRLARSQGVGANEGITRMWAVHQAEVLGDAAAAMTHALRVEIGRGLGKGGPFAAPYYCLGIAHLLAGDSEEAASCLERAFVIYQEGGGGPPAEMLTSSGRLAVAYADLGQSERARETSARGLALLRSVRMPVYLVIVLVFHAQVLRKTQGAAARADIEATLIEAEALIESTGIRAWQPFLHVERAQLARLVGDGASWERELREAHRLFTEMGATGHVERLTAELET